MSLSEDQERETQRIAELEVRRDFDHYLNNVFPEQVRGIKHHTHVAIAGHDSSKKSHGGVELKVNRYRWGFAGITGLLTLLGLIAGAVALFHH